MKRILQSIIAAAIILCHGCSAGGDTITILHTNDTHSHIEPEKNGGGGLENRAALIASEREKAAPGAHCYSTAATFRKARFTTMFLKECSRFKR